MACEAVQMWSLSGLVAAFLDLAIAYLLLCASVVAYFASKFLGFFGLNLPCPCDGVFLNIHSKSLCLSRLLVDFPNQKVSNLQLSVKQKFPFNDYCPKRHDHRIGGDNCVNGILEGDASCSSVSEVVRRDVKGKGVTSHRPRSRLVRRRKGGKNSSICCYDPSAGVDGDSHCSTMKEGNGLIVDNDGEDQHLEYDNKAPTKMGKRQSSVISAAMNYSPNEDMHMNQNIPSIEELRENHLGFQNFSRDEQNTIRLLEQTVEEERIARAALYIELEKERSAAATAADEAMAMILRLQEEKASIEMEARQYQRILEEKSAYDAEEMNILKEIVVRREMEKYFLEKEVEAYRQMVEKLVGDGSDKDDKVSILHQFPASIEKDITMEKKQGDSDEHPPRDSVCDIVGNMDLQEKEIISVENNLQSTSKGLQELKKTIPFAEELEQTQDKNLGCKPAEKIILTCNGTETGDPYYDPTVKRPAKDACLGPSNSCDLMLDKDSHVYDVHIIGDGTEASLDKSEQLSEISSKFCERNSFPFEAKKGTELDAKRSSSAITHGLPPVGPVSSSMLSEMRRSSMSAMDSEMLKMDSEVGRLRERLKFVQEGREKLSLSLENRERENIQLKLLEDIARQVEEIRNLTEPGKTMRQVSLPLPNSKVSSKKRRSRSVSSGLQISSEG
ncbi:hypothetical protein CDL12_13469 [Handroanthus impetiginosus]|uniref:GTD-binding domain-containing protein n=1 Tax=Handroanthus impetiginosus TaxID=429701 RepID=A0A2G9H8P7_9LAMI|nr:hypothetical protein CDL12_13469 [Handroanthus impetiginosus]